MTAIPVENELRKTAAALPRRPGVYLMRDAASEVIYVGKAVDLRARVRTYFAGGDGRSQIEFLMRRVASLEHIVTENEIQAFALERDLITKYKPRYNIRLKDDKAYLSIRVDENAEWPRLELTRKVSEDGARYFGPYAFGYELKVLLETIKRVIPLRTCSDTVFYNRARPCLEYQIKRCCGPCCIAVDRQDYRGLLRQALAILEGKADGLIKGLEEEMERAAAALCFEDAATLRDRLEVLRGFKSHRSLASSYGENRDVFALYREESLATMAVLMVRGGSVSDSQSFFFNDLGITDEEIFESVLDQFYQKGRDIPDEIVLPLDLANISFLRRALMERRGEALELTVPKRGVKARQLDLAALNAKEHFGTHFDAESRYLEIAKLAARLFRLKQMPRRIECLDISNFQGSDIVGAIVVFYDGRPDKGSYRRYRISFQDKPDDFASVHEVVGRRLAEGKETGQMPDLLVIDGGPGQLAMALKARDEAGVGLDIISIAKMKTAGEAQSKDIAKKPERIYLEGLEESLALEDGNELTRFMQRLRDETHRFVITFHRSSRSKRVFRSLLDDIPGVGPERRRRLFKAYGSIENMRKAEVAELAKAGRMPISLAGRIQKVIAGKA